MFTRDVLISIMALAGLAAPARATIVYCNDTSHCTSNTGVTFSTFGAAAGGLGDTMSSPITFVSGGLSSGVYTDAGTGSVFNGFNGTTPEALILSGTSLAQTGTSGNGGNTTNGRSIQIVLPANTYAFAMLVSSVSGTADPFVELVSSPSNFNTSGNYTLSISSSSDSEFFGIISNTAISSIFVGDLFFSQSPITIQSFEVGGPAPTPEVSTFLLIGTGLVLMRFLRRRRQRRPQTIARHPVFPLRSEPDTA